MFSDETFAAEVYFLKRGIEAPSPSQPIIIWGTIALFSPESKPFLRLKKIKIKKIRLQINL